MVWFMGVAYNIRRGLDIGLLVPKTSFEKFGPMKQLPRAVGCRPRYNRKRQRRSAVTSRGVAISAHAQVCSVHNALRVLHF